MLQGVARQAVVYLAAESVNPHSSLSDLKVAAARALASIGLSLVHLALEGSDDSDVDSVASE